MEDSPHNGERLGSGGVGVRGVEVGGVGRGSWVRGWEPPTPIPNTTLLTLNPQPQLSQSQPPYPNPPTPLNPNLSPLCGESSTSALLQTLVRGLHSNSRSHLLCGESSMANLSCGKSSGNCFQLPCSWFKSTL